MTPKTCAFLLYALCTQTVQAAACFSDPPCPSSSGKRLIIDVSHSEESELDHSDKVQALMSPGTESTITEATRLMGMTDSILDIGSCSSGYTSQFDFFQARNSAEMDRREELSVLVDAFLESFSGRIVERTTLTDATDVTDVTDVTDATDATDLTASLIHTDSVPVSTIQTAPAQISQASSPSRLDRKFWTFILRENSLLQARQLLCQNPTFAPPLNDYSFVKMRIIMEQCNTQADLLAFLYKKFPHLFQSKYQNGHYISHVSHPNNVRTLLEIFPYDRNLRIVLLDELINSPQSKLVLEESFFNYIINNNVLLKHMADTRPDLFRVDYHQLPEGPFKQKLPDILSRLSDLLTEEEIRAIY